MRGGYRYGSSAKKSIKLRTSSVSRKSRRIAGKRTRKRRSNKRRSNKRR